MVYPQVQQRTVLVTGCSSGIGTATAETLRRRGWTVFPTARKSEDLDRLRSAGFEPVALDLRDSASVRAAARQALDLAQGNLGALVNNAGFGQPGAIEDLTRTLLRDQFEVNVFGLQELTALLIPGMRRQGCGRIVNVGSILGLYTLPFLGAYCASKYALEALSDALRLELGDAGIAVSLIEPGPIASAFRDHATAAGESIRNSDSVHAARYQRELERRARRDPAQRNDLQSPSLVARAISHALESRRPRRRYPVTWQARLGAALVPFVPTALLDRARRRSVRTDPPRKET